MTTGSGDFSFYGTVWPGTSKLIEEMGELQQVLGKLIAIRGNATEHWSGNLREKLVEEIADLKAALRFFEEKNMTIEESAAVIKRCAEKLALFEKRHEGPPECPDCGAWHVSPGSCPHQERPNGY